jgi:hypothetical protein
MCIIFNALTDPVELAAIFMVVGIAEMLLWLNKFLHSEMNLLIKHTIV